MLSDKSDIIIQIDSPVDLFNPRVIAPPNPFFSLLYKLIFDSFLIIYLTTLDVLSVLKSLMKIIS